MYKEDIKEFLSEVEETTIEGRKVSRVILDINTEKLEVDFEDVAKSANGQSLLESLEESSKVHIPEWQRNLERWKGRHLGHEISQEDYLQKIVVELKLLLQSDFLVPDDEILSKKEIDEASAKLQELGCDISYAKKFCTLCDMIKYEDGVFYFDSTDALENYLDLNEDNLSKKSHDALMRFKFMMEVITQNISTSIKKCTHTQEELILKLTPTFYGDKMESQAFLERIKGMKNIQITELVNEMVPKKISVLSYRRPLWTILHDAGIYTASESNWNMQVKTIGK